jgi:hypothetical protein
VEALDSIAIVVAAELNHAPNGVGVVNDEGVGALLTGAGRSE